MNGKTVLLGSLQITDRVVFHYNPLVLATVMHLQVKISGLTCVDLQRLIILLSYRKYVVFNGK
jgi:hypothetical protein